MATHDTPILGFNYSPDDSSLVYPEPLEAGLTLGTAALGTTMGITMSAPSGADVGIYGKFNIPQTYVGTPLIVIRGVLAQAANVLAFGIQQRAVADSGTIDIAYEPEDTSTNSTWTGYAVNDMYEQLITLTPAAAYVAGQEVFYFFYRDDSADTQTAAFHLTGLFFRWNDA